jgi:hypothetical protein
MHVQSRFQSRTQPNLPGEAGYGAVPIEMPLMRFDIEIKHPGPVDTDVLCFVVQTPEEVVFNVLNGDELERPAPILLIVSDLHTPETNG